MPMMTGGVQGYTGLVQQLRLCLEPTSGEQLLMPQTVGAATMSLTTQPSIFSPTTGMALHVYVLGNAAAGTITFAGTAPVTGSPVTSITYHVNPAPQNNQGYTEFTTKEVFATINSSGITLSGGLTAGCQIIVLGSYAGKFLLPITFDGEEKITHFSPPDKRGILFKNFRVSQLTKETTLDKFDCSLYPDSLWAYYMLVGNSPNITTVPATPTILLAPTTKAATMTLTTPPTAPGMFLIFSIAGNSLAGTIAITGTDNFGTPVSETITVSASQTTVYSSKRYSALGSNQFTTTGLSASGVTIGVTGVFAWTYSFTYDGVNNYTPYSAALEVFDGVMGKKLPGTILSDGNFDWQKEKEIAFTAKGQAQDYLIVGDPNPTTYPSGTNPFSTIAQPTSLPVVSWPASWYIDSGSGVPFTTQDGSLLTCKIGIVTGRKYYYSGDGQQRASYVTWESAPDFSADGTMIFQNIQNYEQYFKPNMPLLLGATFQGNLLGYSGSNVYYENVQWTLPIKFDSYKPDASKNPVEIAFKSISEYSLANLGLAYKVAVTAQVPPTYVS